jgi:hypothetical protein
MIVNRGMRFVKGPTYINSKIWDYDFVIVDNKIILTEYTGSNENVVIPDKILFMPIVEVGNEQYDKYTLGKGIFQEKLN